MGDFVQLEIARIRELVGDRALVLGAVSGGVDSTVAAALMRAAIGDRFKVRSNNFISTTLPCRRITCASSRSSLRQRPFVCDPIANTDITGHPDRHRLYASERV